MFLGHSGDVYNVTLDLDSINGQIVAGRFFEEKNIILIEAIRSQEAPGQAVGDHGNVSLGHKGLHNFKCAFSCLYIVI